MAKPKQTIEQLEELTLELIAKLGLTDWRIAIKIAGPSDFTTLNDCIASVMREVSDRCATISFNPAYEIHREDIAHELLELMLADYDLYLRSDVTEDMRSALRHRLIVRLENLL